MLVLQGLLQKGESLGLDNYTILCYTIFVVDRFSLGGIMQTRFMLQKEFKVWMCATLGLLKDGKMGVSVARADRIKLALAYTGAARR